MYQSSEIADEAPVFQIRYGENWSHSHKADLDTKTHAKFFAISTLCEIAFDLLN